MFYLDSGSTSASLIMELASIIGRGGAVIVMGEGDVVGAEKELEGIICKRIVLPMVEGVYAFNCSPLPGPKGMHGL